MFVKNYYSLIQGLFSIKNSGSAGITVKRVTGANVTPYFEVWREYTEDKLLLMPRLVNTHDYNKIAKAFRSGLSWSYCGMMELALGTGDTEPTIDDYTLSGDLISTFSIIESATETSLVNNISTHTFQAVIKNTGSSDFTIKEVALLYNCRVGGATNAGYSIMIERSVLDKPITIEPDNTATITYKVKTVVPAIPTA